MTNSFNIDLFSETFGQKKNPAILLHAGAGGQSTSWPDAFCRELADTGYRVVRYDYRDTGLSSAIDYEQHPYTALDLAQDAIQVLHHNHIEKAHCVGFSMGGQIAQLMAAHFPDQVNSIILIGTSCDFGPGLRAFEGQFNPQDLSPPDPHYIQWAGRSVDISHQTIDERILDYVKTCYLLDGQPLPFDAEFFKAKGLRNMQRTTLQTPYINHAKCMKASLTLHAEALQHIYVPTLILHGKKDPVFPIDHAHAMQARIPNAKLVVLEDFAHALSPRHFNPIVQAIDGFIKNANISGEKR